MMTRCWTDGRRQRTAAQLLGDLFELPPGALRPTLQRPAPLLLRTSTGRILLSNNPPRSVLLCFGEKKAGLFRPVGGQRNFVRLLACLDFVCCTLQAACFSVPDGRSVTRQDVKVQTLVQPQRFTKHMLQTAKVDTQTQI